MVGFKEGTPEGIILNANEGDLLGRADGLLDGRLVGLRVGDLAHNTLQVFALHCASGLQQSASEVQPYPDTVTIQFLPVLGL